jgi:RND family efflux transporter MFP subunit
MKRLLKNKITWIIAVIVVIAALLWNRFGQPTKKTVSQTTHTVKKETIRQTLTITGKLDAKEKITLRFQSSGLLAWVGVKEGDMVTKYQAIAGLDQQELQKNLQKYLNTYENERRDFDQTKDEYRQPAQGYWGLTWDQRNDADRALQKAQFDLNSSVLDVELKNISLKYATLFSPISGIVTTVGSPVAGVNVTPTQAEFEIVNPDSLYLSVLPDQTEVSTITSSQSADIVFDAFLDEHIDGQVESIAFTPKEGETSTVYEVNVRFPLVAMTKYRIGMTADATFTTSEKVDVLAVPIRFIKSENGKNYVMKQTGKGKEKQFVQIGIESDDMTEITGGLAEGDILYD